MTSRVEFTRDQIRDWCREQVAALLGVQAETIDPTVTFDRLGLDSALAVSLLIEIEERFGVEVPSKTLFDDSNIESIAAYLYTELRLGGA
ncbi:acyl carrier protein [Micromonospora sp. DT4]|uniref:acyl carrier protein n=1 Tax=Micromonospora sp. DT4 TaxID=3393438 RepID=UPI003CF653CC